MGEPGCARAVLETIPPVMYFIRQEMRSHRRADLTVPQLRALVFIRRYPDSCLKMVAENVGLSLPAAAGNLVMAVVAATGALSYMSSRRGRRTRTAPA